MKWQLWLLINKWKIIVDDEYFWYRRIVAERQMLENIQILEFLLERVSNMKNDQVNHYVTKCLNVFFCTTHDEYMRMNEVQSKCKIYNLLNF